jgi:hypothetical protein
MTALAAILGVGVGLALVGGRWAGRGVALVCLVVGAFVAWGGAWAAVGPAVALAALLRRQEERAAPPSTLWAPLTLVGVGCGAVAWAAANSTIPTRPDPAVMASIEALRGEWGLGLGVLAMVALAALKNEEDPP